MWLTETRNQSPQVISSRIARVAMDGSVTGFDLGSAAVGPTLLAGPGGALWFVQGPTVERLTYAGQRLSSIAMPAGRAATVLSRGPGGNVWTISTKTDGGPPFRIARITPQAAVAEFGAFSPNGPHGYPASITPGSDGNLWFLLNAVKTAGTPSQVGRIAASGFIDYFAGIKGSTAGHTGALALGGDGAVWFPMSATTPSTPGPRGFIGRITADTAPIGGFAPSLSSVVMTSHVFRAARRGGSLAVAVGTTVRFRLSRPGRRRFQVERPIPRTRRFAILRGSFTATRTFGPGSVRFTGRLAGRALPPGPYRLAMTPTDLKGHAGRTVRQPFRIVP
jgi:hypothetical protein